MLRIFCTLVLLMGIGVVTGCGRADDEVKPLPPESQKKAHQEYMEGMQKAMKEKMQGRKGGPSGRPQ